RCRGIGGRVVRGRRFSCSGCGGGGGCGSRSRSVAVRCGRRGIRERGQTEQRGDNGDCEKSPGADAQVGRVFEVLHLGGPTVYVGGQDGADSAGGAVCPMRAYTLVAVPLVYWVN